MTAVPTPLTFKYYVLAFKPVAVIRPSLTSTFYRKRKNFLLLVNPPIRLRAEKWRVVKDIRVSVNPFIYLRVKKWRVIKNTRASKAIKLAVGLLKKEFKV